MALEESGTATSSLARRWGWSPLPVHHCVLLVTRGKTPPRVTGSRAGRACPGRHDPREPNMLISCLHPDRIAVQYPKWQRQIHLFRTSTLYTLSKLQQHWASLGDTHPDPSCCSGDCCGAAACGSTGPTELRPPIGQCTAHEIHLQDAPGDCHATQPGHPACRPKLTAGFDQHPFPGCVRNKRARELVYKKISLSVKKSGCMF
jgi:hypothetical protein